MRNLVFGLIVIGFAASVGCDSKSTSGTTKPPSDVKMGTPPAPPPIPAKK